MNVEDIKSLFLKHKESSLNHRYITNNNIEPLLKKFDKSLSVNTIGKSVLGNPIYSINVGNGNKKILMWSQMHGNESTTTKAIFDILNTLLSKDSNLDFILQACTLCIIPILNPDGAIAYTRVNAKNVDLNRDAQHLSQPESKVIKSVFDEFKPHFCYNLHGQRTIFSAGKTNKPATVSFLAPAQDKDCTITSNRKIAMEVIGIMNTMLQNVIPNQVGVYDDAFNLNCVGDTFQSANVPTILFEAGHFYNDYARDKTREYIYISMLESLNYISNNIVDGSLYKTYFDIPENEKCFFDVVIRNAKLGGKYEGELQDIGVMYHETLKNNKIEFVPKVEKIEKLDAFFAHKTLNANGFNVCDIKGNELQLGYENDFVMMNNEKIALFEQ